MPPAAELRGVAKATPLHVVVRDLRDELGANRLPRQILSLTPAALHSRPPVGSIVRRRFGPGAPRVPVEGMLAIGRQKLHELATLLVGEARTHADVLEVAVVVVEAEEERADRRSLRVLVPAESGDNAIAVALVLDLEHDAPVRLIDAVLRFCHHAVEARTLEAPEPIGGRGAVARRGRDVERRRGVGEHRLELGAPLRKWGTAQIVIVLAEHVEEHDRGRRLTSECFHARRGRVQSQLQGLEIEDAA